jgi:glycosyltransferase involved in cell wall biosynthesis
MAETDKINVLQFICPTGFYGAERWILALAKHLPGDATRTDLAVTLEKNSRDLTLVKKFRNDYGEAFELPMSNRFDLGIIGKLTDLIRKRNIDIIHTHGYKSDILGVLAARKSGIKCVVTPHGFENAADLKLRLFMWLGCKAMSHADAVAPLSLQLMDDSRQAGVSESRLVYIQNGVDLSEIEALRKDTDGRSESPAKRVGFIGQLIGRKNLIDVLDVFDGLAARHESIRLIIVGDGEQRCELEAHARRLNSHERIEFTGFRQDRLELLQSFDLFVMTSTLEGIPRCLMEAFAMGVPVAAYDIPGIDQLVSHGETGLLAALKDRQQLASCWEKLLFDPAEARRISANARRFVKEQYSADRMARDYLELYRRLIN